MKLLFTSLNYFSIFFYSFKLKNSFQNNEAVFYFKVPFYSQRIDCKWKEMNFPSFEEAQCWQWESCGIACLQMVIEGLTEKPAPKFYDLITEVNALGGYDKYRGWIHQKLADSLKKYNIRAHCKSHVVPEAIAYFINQKKIMIASVGVGFENKKNRGHLIVIIGYRMKDGKISGFIIHHPSAKKEYEWPYYFVDIERFKSHFSGNIIICNKE